MSPIDKNDQPLVAHKTKPRLKGAATVQYTLPKPYRRRAGPDEREPVSKVKLAALALAGLLTVGLVAELIALVQENLRVKKLPVVVAITPGAIAPSPAPAAPPGVVAEPAPPALAEAGVAVPAPLPEPLPEPAADDVLIATNVPEAVDTAMAAAPMLPPAAAPVAPASRSARSSPSAPAPRSVRPKLKPKRSAPVIDPDVVLVAAILRLTPRPELSNRVAVCDPGTAQVASCPEIRGMVP